MHHLFNHYWIRLGPVLMRSWTRLGMKQIPLMLENVYLHERLHLQTNLSSRHILSPTWCPRHWRREEDCKGCGHEASGRTPLCL